MIALPTKFLVHEEHLKILLLNLGKLDPPVPAKFKLNSEELEFPNFTSPVCAMNPSITP